MHFVIAQVDQGGYTFIGSKACTPVFRPSKAEKMLHSCKADISGRLVSLVGGEVGQFSELQAKNDGARCWGLLTGFAKRQICICPFTAGVLIIDSRVPCGRSALELLIIYSNRAKD